ncbi:polyamine aminopropyltransferase [Yimella sp. cx-573]|nr:polyamine aminopropyltransferase [Yimella sp. cx-573]
MGAVFVCAACGLVYELALVALGSYLLGSTIAQASIVLSVMVFAMGVGALISKRLTSRAAVNFAVIELLLALLGGTSVVVLYAAFAWLSMYQPMLVVLAFVLGLLIGAEIPLLMTLLQRIRAQDATSAVADLFAADYVGALLGGLAFPFVLLPWFGLLRGTLLVGAINAVVGVVVCAVVFRDELGRAARAGLASGLVAVLAVLGGLGFYATQFELSAQQQIYRDPIALTKRSAYQDIVLTRSLDGQDVRLFLNGDLQFSTLDEYRYHEALVTPAMNGPRGRVLVLGGGDGLAAARILKYPGVQQVTLVDLDPAVVQLARTEPDFLRHNDDAMNDRRMKYIAADAFTWLRGQRDVFDVIVVDFPDPDDVATAKLYSTEIYGLMRRALAPGGRMVVQSGSPYFSPKAFWTIESTLKASGLTSVPYHVDVPSFGDWGFHLAQVGTPPQLRVPADAPAGKFIDEAVLQAARAFPPDRARRPMPPSTLLHPRILDAVKGSYRGY